jgi:hypothetical protein
MAPRRLLPTVIVLVCALVFASAAAAHDCIRVSSSHQGLVKSTSHSGNWLLFDFSSGAASLQTFEILGVSATPAQADCFSAAYAQSGQPQFFALGIGVAGKNGVLAHNNPNERVLSDGHGIDHIDDSPILGAAGAAAGACGIDLGDA